MPGDFKTVRDELVAQVLNSHPSTSSLVAAAMVRQLTALEPEAVPFMEKSGAFNTKAGQAAYGPDDVGFPKSLHRFDRLYYDLGSTILPIDTVDEYTVRYFQEYPVFVYPTRACWLEKKLQFGPAPAGIYPVKWDCILNSKLDAATGDAITEASEEETNPWLSEGAVVFKHLVLADYYANDTDPRQDLAQSNGAYAQSQLAQLRKAQQAKKAMNTFPVVPNAFDRYVVANDRRIQALFPGAHG